MGRGTLTGTGERGSQNWGLLIKVGLVDPLMKVQLEGYSPVFYPDGSEKAEAANGPTTGEEG